MSEADFDKDMELAKLQVKMSEWHTFYYTSVAVIVSAMVTICVLGTSNLVSIGTVIKVVTVLWAKP